MMKFLMSVIVVICIILLIVANVNCTTKTATPSIHSSRVVSTAEDFTSSCVVVEEGVPVCQDEDEDEDEDDTRSATRTPYLKDNYWSDRARDRKSPTESGSRALSWWWRFVGELRRNLGKKASAAATTVVRSDASQQPETIVTYSIKGCSPTIVPFDLSPCSNLSPDVPQPVSTTRVIYYVPPLSRVDSYSPSDFDQ
ncbi:uncharacterized protein LOC100574240 [Acyrthosiphon pisum]|uniref:Secreted protein n=1 Tax=Acyrthosiphon pisum TaxID=7029 RepID=A0A8R1W6F4_ACYPI|nr:uncharacterized protein LOC100574240 [Acyrthosiphon pisum]|eukprot:XP_003245743.1 PREDICTED: uncharacterized protein LOC100574240 [Acyrthosiphon pisum]